MIIRCANCGSKNVEIIKNKDKSYDFKKGFVGQALIGTPGALSGFNTKETTQYHCLDCGTLNVAPMHEAIVQMLDERRANPKLEFLLQHDMERYPNYDWDSLPQVEKNNESAEELIYNYIIKKEGSGADLVDIQFNVPLKAFGIKNEINSGMDTTISEFNLIRKFLDNLISEGKVEKRGNKYVAVEDIKAIEENALKATAETKAKKYISNHSNRFEELMKANFEYEKYYSADDFIKKQKEVFSNFDSSENPYFLEILCNEFNAHLQSQFKLSIFEISEDSFEYFLETEEGAHKLKLRHEEILEELEDEEEESLKEEEKRKEEFYLKCGEIIKKILETSNKGQLSILEILEELNFELTFDKGFEISLLKCQIIINYLVESNILEREVISKTAYISLPGYLEKKQQEKRENERRIQEKKYNSLLVERDMLVEQINTLSEEKDKCSKLYESNKSKLFGEGAKIKKESKAKLDEIETQLSKLKLDHKKKEEEIKTNLDILNAI